MVKDSHQQIGMLKKMMSIIQNGELLKRLRDSKDKTEILSLLSALDEV